MALNPYSDIRDFELVRNLITLNYEELVEVRGPPQDIQCHWRQWYNLSLGYTTSVVYDKDTIDVLHNIRAEDHQN